MKRNRLIGASLLTTVGLVWCVCAGLTSRALLKAPDRDRELGRMALQYIMNSERQELDAAVHRIEQDLLKEAAFAQAQDSLEEKALLKRWEPLMRGEWPIRAVTLACENGTSLELMRSPVGWLSTSTLQGPETGPQVVMEWPYAREMDSAYVHIGGEVTGPRRATWFGQALENHGAGPAWTLSNDSVGPHTHVDVALLLRAHGGERRYRVLRFSVSVRRLLRSMGAPPATHVAVYLNSNGAPLYSTDSVALEADDNAVLTQWSATNSNEAWALHGARGDRMAQILPYHQNGMQLYLGAIIRLDRISAWSKGERRLLWAALVFLAILGALLAWMLVRVLERDRRLQSQEKRSLTQERKLAKALGEREVLDREVHHRVKNNLQVVSSLLNLQAGRVTDPKAQLEVARGKQRIDSMALVHHKLYAQKDLRAIDLQVLLTQIADAMNQLWLPKSRHVSHTVSAPGITADADTGIQLGTILCELLSNCYQHAFPYITGGHVDISVTDLGGGEFRLRVQDNGRGIDRGQATGRELGLELVEALADQIDGKVTVRAEDGTCVDVTFRMLGEAPILDI